MGKIVKMGLSWVYFGYTHVKEQCVVYVKGCIQPCGQNFALDKGESSRWRLGLWKKKPVGRSLSSPIPNSQIPNNTPPSHPSIDFASSHCHAPSMLPHVPPLVHLLLLCHRPLRRMPMRRFPCHAHSCLRKRQAQAYLQSLIHNRT
jgi:hypothetical protein